MQKIRSSLNSIILVSEFSHLFCCVLPTIAAISSMFIGTGGFLPAFVKPFHDVMHAYEMPLMAFSAMIIAAGWGVYRMATKTDCQGLGHEEKVCHKTMAKTKKILTIGTVLFIFNFLIFVFFHLGH